jgi:hypothetical protein
LGISAIGIVIARGGLVPSKITALGIEFGESDQRALLRMLAAVVLYFLFAFVIYATSDFVIWRTTLGRAVATQTDYVPGTGLFWTLRDFAISRLSRSLEVLTNPEAIHEARALLAEQIGTFTLQRVEENGKVSYKANGMIDFFGDEAFTELSGAGARITRWRPRFGSVLGLQHDRYAPTGHPIRWK